MKCLNVEMVSSNTNGEVYKLTDEESGLIATKDRNLVPYFLGKTSIIYITNVVGDELHGILLKPHEYQEMKARFIKSRMTGIWGQELKQKPAYVDFFLKETSDPIGSRFGLLEEYSDIKPKFVYDEQRKGMITMVFKLPNGYAWAPVQTSLSDQPDKTYQISNNETIHPRLDNMITAPVYNLKCTGSVRSVEQVIWSIEYITEDGDNVMENITLNRSSINPFWMTHIEALKRLNLINL